METRDPMNPEVHETKPVAGSASGEQAGDLATATFALG
jgi:hypothetical protein